MPLPEKLQKTNIYVVILVKLFDTFLDFSKKKNY